MKNPLYRSKSYFSGPNSAKTPGKETLEPHGCHPYIPEEVF
jgi:hypothetical protein